MKVEWTTQQVGEFRTPEGKLVILRAALIYDPEMREYGLRLLCKLPGELCPRVIVHVEVSEAIERILTRAGYEQKGEE